MAQAGRKGAAYREDKQVDLIGQRMPAMVLGPVCTYFPILI